MMSSRFLARSANVLKASAGRQAAQKAAPSRSIATAARAQGNQLSVGAWALTTGAAVTLMASTLMKDEQAMMERKSSSGMPVVMFGDPVKEPDTGIMFPPMVNGFTLMGCGVRIKYVFVKVYAVGAYLNPMNFSGLKDDASIEKALLDPNNHRTIRIVMNRNMTMEKYNDAIVEALTPRMNGQDMDKLEEFKKLNPPGPLEKDTELLMTIRGDTLLYKNASGNVGTLKSEVFCKALCDVYFGSDPVSPPAKKATIDAIKKL